MTGSPETPLSTSSTFSLTRISRHVMWMEIAQVAAKRSTCSRANVGAVLVSKSSLISLGYNGPPPGHPHCTGPKCAPQGYCYRATHAEENAIYRAPREDVSGCDLYVTRSPCTDCAEIIADAGIDRVFYQEEYRDPLGVSLLRQGGVDVYRMTPNGWIIDGEGNLVDIHSLD